MVAPLSAYALTGGPSQPEVQSFEPANTNQMVDPFTGDFVYNLPLLDVEGYPINLSYHSGITMDQEASWVGLGWNINPGVINRSMRGLPDDFNEEDIVKEYNIKKNWTAGVDLGFNMEVAGFGFGTNTGVYYNNYRGVGFRASTSFSFSISSDGAQGKNTAGISPNIGLGLSIDSQEGIGVSPSLGIGTESDNVNMGASVGFNYSSREGFKGITYGFSVSSKSQMNRNSEGKAISTKISGSSLGSFGSSISFASQAMMPYSSFPMETFAFTGKLKLGGEIPNVIIKLSGSIGGSYTQQKLQTRKKALKGYGYLYMDRANTDPSALLDFNREKDLPFRIPNSKSGDEGSPVLSVPSYQYDLLSVSGQGIGGQYRAKRGDVGSVYDPAVNDLSGSGALNVDVGIGLYAAIGVDFNVTVIEGSTSSWTKGNKLENFLRFSGTDNTPFEPSYFVNVGEKTINDQTFYDSFGDTDPIRAKISGGGLSKEVDKRFEVFKNSIKTKEIVPVTNKKATREKRNQVISYLTAEESVAAQDKYILDYPINQFPISHCGNTDSSIYKINRLIHSGNRKDHISEISVLSPDGKRYVYGIPAYNRIQREVTFSVDGNSGDMNTGLATYSPGSDNTVNNSKGAENYFSADNIPGYAHSYLLTAVLSPDYVDLTNDGVSADDLGDAVRINYTRTYGDGDNDGRSLYKWRVPHNTNKANYQQGYKTQKRDDKASYLSGEKEIWYVNSIESKTKVAVFRLGYRDDGLGVMGENGGKNTSAKLGKLDRIDLYSKTDLQKNGNNAVPIKSVHFEYSYELCPGIGNSVNGGGKLTLKKVHFTYQNNTKGKLNPYTFAYNAFNPSYHIKHYDRWGNYQNNQEAGLAIPETEFPYTIQNVASADKNAAAWSLKSIGLPTGGTINVDIEADRYAYVQDKRAMQMFTILGFGKDSTVNPGGIDNRLYTSSNYKDNNIHNRYVYVKVNESIPSSGSTDYIRKHYMEGVSNLFFNIAVKMPEHGLADAEYVNGYCNIERYGLCTGQSNIIWIRLAGEPINNSGAHVANPIAKTAWQFLRMNLPSLAYPGSSSLDDGSTSFMDVIKALVGPLGDIKNMLIGFNKSCVSKGWCQETVPKRSWIRLNNPNYAKLGGGARVKKVTLSDNWAHMVSGERPAEYGQVYDYTMIDEETNEIISSGDAEYEPMIGNNENPFHQPLKYRQETPMAPHNSFFIEYPVGETVFPGPNVGYRQVSVTSYASAQTNDIDKRTGYTVHKFYTGYDFPIITDRTPSGEDAFHYNKTPSILKLFQMGSSARFKGTQGFKVELNDMHGKPRSEAVYANDSTLISSTEYTYQSETISQKQAHLTNEVAVLTPDGKIKAAQIGKEVEVMFDSRQQRTTVSSGGAVIQVDIDGFTVPFPVPIPIPTGFPSFSRDETQFNSITSTKVVRRYGILKRVTARQYGSSTTTENLVYDSETGEVVLTRTQNEFNAPVFNFTYPAHFAYKGMGPASENAGAIFTKVTISNGLIVSPSNIAQYFTPGDEVLLSREGHPNAKYMAWVIDPQSINPAATSQKRFIDQQGHPISITNAGLKIVRSGHRNMQSLPIATITSLVNPFDGSGNLNPDQTDKILNTAATEYSEQWKVNCEKVTTSECDSCAPINCECLADIIDKVKDSHNAGYDAIVDVCCLENSCLFPDGSLSRDTVGCHKEFVHTLSDTMVRTNRPFQMRIGKCIVTVAINLPGIFSKKYVSGSLYTITAEISDSDSINSCQIYDSTGVAPAFIRDSLTNDLIPVKVTIECDKVCRNTCVTIDSNQVVNPYRLGLLGSWRPEKQWVYRDFRTPSVLGGSTNLRADGIFQSYDKFWVYDSVKKKFMATPSSKYIEATTTTKYNPKGAEIENRDAAGIYSSAVYGYLQTQPVAVAKNARYKQIGFDGFEDYDFINDCLTPCRTDHFSYSESLDSSGVIIDSIAHTGHRSVKVQESITMAREIKYDNGATSLVYNDSVYKLTAQGCLPKFSPDSGRYFFSAWVKEAAPCYSSSYQNNEVNISFSGAPATYTFAPSGKIIEGWQRIEGEFHIPSSATRIYVELKSLSGNIYFDDVRIQPFNSSMKTYVYNWRTLQLMAELDENNFATFYEYDDSGNLIRIKKETERGIMTVQETRSTLKKL